MSPNLEPGDRVLAVRHWPKKWLKRGQVVVVTFQAHKELINGSNQSVKKTYIKRIIGLSNDIVKVDIRDLPEHLRSSQIPLYNDNFERIWHVPHDHIFLQGDNHKFSTDSRVWGPIPMSALEGLVVVRLTPSRNSKSDYHQRHTFHK